MQNLISVAEAESIIYSAAKLAPTIEIPIEKAVGEILRQSICSERDQPPFDRVAMDGIALRVIGENSQRDFYTLAGCQKAGSPAGTIENDGDCLEIMTGAVLPKGANTVVPYEELRIRDNKAYINSTFAVLPWKNIHRRGCDMPKNSLILDQGRRLSAFDIAALATNGHCSVLVSKRPKIAFVSTGDEIVSVDKKPEDHQIRMSNGYAVEADLASLGFNDVNKFHLPDDKKLMFERLQPILRDYDLVLISGGVSKGKYDYIPSLLKDLGVEERVRGVRQRPGKPLWFGLDAVNSTPVFGLPGNPVSTSLCTRHYVIPFLLRQLGEDNTLQQGLGRQCIARLGEDVVFNKKLGFFMPCQIKVDDSATINAFPVKTNGSGDFLSLIQSQGYVYLQENQDFFPRGSVVPLLLFG